MTGEAIVKALGKPYEHADVQRLTQELGLTKVPKAKPDEPDSDLEAKKFGVSLGFIDGDYLAAKKVARYGNADMIFHSAGVYNVNGEPGYKPYQGTLPKGVLMSDSQDQLKSKLGPPTQVTEYEGTIRALSWDLPDVWLSFDYKATGELKLVGMMLPAYMKLMRSKK